MAGPVRIKLLKDIMKKFPLKDKVFWINFFWGVAIFIGLSIIIGGIDMVEDGGNYSFLTGYLITSFFAVIILCGKIAREFARGVEIDEFIVENNLDRKELREKYGKLFDI